MTVVVITIPASARSISCAIEQITEFGAEIGLEKSECFETKVVVAEALNNIVGHTPPEDTAASITIRCRLLNNGMLEIIIQDRGQAFSLQAREHFPAGLSEGGRGCPIISRWTDSVEYQRQHGFNTLILKKSITCVNH